MLLSGFVLLLNFSEQFPLSPLQSSYRFGAHVCKSALKKQALLKEMQLCCVAYWTSQVTLLAFGWW